jgi:Phosphotransferase enzyme family
VTRDHLARASRAALGSRRQLDGVARLAGGTTKGVYRLTLDDGSTVIAYLWEESENFWPQTPHDGDPADQFSSGNNPDLFEAAHHRLASLGLRVPEIYLLDRDRAYYPADIAILEDFPGEDLLEFYERDPAAAEPTLARLREGLAAMRNYRGTSPGKVGHVDTGGVSHWPSCEEGALDFALRCLAEAAGRDRRITDTRERFEDRLRELAAAVRPRAEYSVVHGELGLDHVLVDEPDREITPPAAAPLSLSAGSGWCLGGCCPMRIGGRRPRGLVQGDDVDVDAEGACLAQDAGYIGAAAG